MDGEDARGWEDVPRASGAVIFLNDTAYESGEFQAVHDPLPVADWIAAMRRGGFGVSVMPDAALELEGGPYAGGTVVETEMMGGRCYFVVPPEALDWLEHVWSEQEYRQMRADVTPAVGSYAGMAADVPVSAAADWAPEASRVATVLYLDPVPLWDCRRLVPLCDPIPSGDWADKIRRDGMRVTLLAGEPLPLDGPCPGGQVVIVDDGARRYFAVPTMARDIVADLLRASERRTC